LYQHMFSLICMRREGDSRAAAAGLFVAVQLSRPDRMSQSLGSLILAECYE
jgi:hypothetical protein